MATDFTKNISFSCHFYRVLAICVFRAEGFLFPVGALERHFIVKLRGPFIVSFVKLYSSWSVYDLLHHVNMSV